MAAPTGPFGRRTGIILCLLLVVITGTQLLIGQDQTTEAIYGDPKKIKIRSLQSINQSGVDYAPTVSADGKTLFFVSERQGGMIHKTQGTPSHDFWRVKRSADSDTTYSIPEPLTEINTNTDEGVASISADRQTLYYALCDREDGFGSCDLWEAQLNGDRFVRPRQLGPNVNTKYWESQPYISPDGSRLYFSSNRPRFTGENHDPEDYDIWYCDWDPIRKEWKPARNIGDEVNTPGMEAAPFIAPDGKTLFFSSNGRTPSIGGMDFYHTMRIPELGTNGESGRETWTKPELVPEPINSSADDQFLSMPVSGDILYFASRRSDIQGARGDFDLYAAKVPKVVGAVNLVVSVRDACTDGVVPSKVTITNQLTQRTVTANVDGGREDVNIVLSDEDFVSLGQMKDTLPMSIDIYTSSYGRRHRDLKLPISVLYATSDVEETFMIDQRKRLYADFQNKDGRTQIGLSVSEEVIHQRLLPYIFYDRNSADIPKRYRRIKTEQTNGFTESFAPRNALTDYYHVLNVVGARLTKLPDLQLVITGYRDELSECDGAIGQRRALGVRSYLVDVWKIPSERIIVESGGWPKNRSNPDDSLGAAENRRCELSVTGPTSQQQAFNAPLVTTWVEATSTIPNVRFLTGIDANDQGLERRVEIRAGDKVIRQIDIDPASSYVAWSVTQDAAVIASSPQSPLQVNVVTIRPDGQSCPIDTMSIPVQLDPATVRRTKELKPTVFRIHSFDPGTFDLSTQNQQFLSEYVLPKLKGARSIEVTGFTDVVGMYDHNQFVSEQYAESVSDFMNENDVAVRDNHVSGVGEDRPRYSNRFPEGRFYNRAVEIRTK
jgi:outer membrane protein OmpA-like peptidoglycan-associated protein